MPSIELGTYLYSCVCCKTVEEHVDAVDVNLGCPQGIAKRGHYGSFLMEEWELVESIGTNAYQIAPSHHRTIAPSIYWGMW
jgi:hypothetical protein